MNEARHSALEYLQSSSYALWQWSDGGREVVWQDGTTLAFREEIGALVKHLAGAPLPPFTALVLLLAACRGKRPPFVAIGPRTENAQGLLRDLKARMSREVSAEFEKFSAFPDALVRTLEGKVFLAQLVFEAFLDRSPLEPGEVVNGIQEIWTDAELNTGGTRAGYDAVTRWTHSIAEALKPYDGEALLRRMRLGVSGLPTAADGLELPLQERARRFLSELAGDPQYSGCAALTKELMAALRLPQRISQIDDLIFAGNAGLGNRGTLDRLLVSELAHDDTTLANRIAMNEALYVHREPPATKPDRQLSILIDTGLRMWGVPRLLATSAALGLLAGHKGNGKVRVWRSEAGALVEASLLTRQGLEAQLAVLGTELDARGAMVAADQLLQAEAETDFVLITSRSAFESEAFRTCVATARFASGYLVTVDRVGTVQLHRFPWGNPRALAEVQVEVERLMTAPPGPGKASAPTETLLGTDQPAILNEKRLPLLLPICSEVSFATRTKDGGVCVVDGKRLLKWAGVNRGARELHNNLPQGKTVWLGADEAGRTVVVKGRHGKISVVITHDTEAKSTFTQFTELKVPHHAFLDKNVVVLILHKQVTVCSLDGGHLLSQTTWQDGLEWISERYFSTGLGVAFVYWNGTSVEWDAAVSGRPLVREKIALAFDRQGSGCWLLLKDGRVISPTGGEYMNLGIRVARAESKRRGDRLWVVEEGEAKHFHVNLEVKKANQLASEHLAAAIERVIPPMRATQTRFSAIHAAPGMPVRLRKPKGKWLELHATQRSLRFAESAAENGGLEPGMLAFKPQPHGSAGFTLQVAVWPNGSKAWLDSRGLLHLRSCDPDWPELTLTLGQGDVAAWTSEGKIGGAPFYFDGPETIGISGIAALLKGFADRL